ncbi:MAG TPA: alpha/beta fold hydrolase [Candidatus Lustribacter sp.]|nr:alpha/beta fold hydrolase [Candidatus Lustribacter sp.]
MNVELLRVPAGKNTIAVLAYEARRPRGVTLVVGHGYSSSKHNLDMLCSFLAGHGFTVYSLDFPGHKLGAGGGRLDAATDLMDAMHAVVAHARANGATTLYVMGHSMGATTALCTAGDDPTIAGAISIATGYGRPQALDALARGGVVDLRSAYVDGLPLPELAAQWQPLLDAALPKLAGRPTFFIAAERDAMVARASVDDLFARAPDPKSFAVVNSDHTFAGDNSRATVLTWLNERHARG